MAGLFFRAGLSLVAAAALLVSASSACAAAERRSVDAHAAWLAPHVEIRLPESASSPVPTALLFHGCGGLRSMQDDYAASLNAAGYGAVIIDSMAPRGIGRAGAMTQVCTALRLRGQVRAADVFAAVELARRTPGIDPDRLVLVGWSHGGWAILDALTFAADDSLPPGLSAMPGLAGVQAAVLMYPYCSFPARARRRSIDTRIAIDAVLAGRDMVASTADCRQVLERASDAGVTVSWDLWPGLTHAFDEPGNPDPRMQFNAEAARAAHQRLIGRLDALADR